MLSQTSISLLTPTPPTSPDPTPTRGISPQPQIKLEKGTLILVLVTESCGISWSCRVAVQHAPTAAWPQSCLDTRYQSDRFRRDLRGFRHNATFFGLSDSVLVQLPCIIIIIIIIIIITTTNNNNKNSACFNRFKMERILSLLYCFWYLSSMLEC